VQELADHITGLKRVHRARPKLKDRSTLLHAIGLLERVHGQNKASSYTDIIDSHDPLKRKGK
jgi:hypothetical protein